MIAWLRRALSLMLVAPVWLLAAAPQAEADFFRSNLEQLTVPSNWREIDMPGQLEVWSMAAGPNGEIWIGSVASAARYDGTTWQDFPLPEGVESGPIQAICRSRSGVVYALTPVALFALEKSSWRQVAPIVSRLYPTGVIYESRSGDIWVGHDSGFAVVRTDGRVRNINTGRYVVSFCEDREGYLWWVEGERREVYRAMVSTDAFEATATWQLMLPAFHEPVRFASLEATPDGRIWLSDIKRNDPLRYYDLTRKIWVEKVFSSVVESNDVSDMAQDASGRLWLWVAGRLAMIDRDTVRSFAPTGGPTLQMFMQLVFAQDNSVWLSPTRGRPIRLDLSGGPWRKQAGYHFQCEAYGSRWYIAEDGEIIAVSLADPAAEPVGHRARGAIEHPVGMFVSQQGEVWAIGANKGVAAFSIYDGRTWQQQAFPEFATGFDFDSYCERANGAVLLGSGQFWDAPPAKAGGLIEVQRKGQEWVKRIWPQSPDGFPDRVHEVVETPTGDVFAGGSRFIRLRGGQATNENRSLKATGAWISSLKLASDGVLWGSSYGKGIFRSRGPEYEWFRSFERGLGDVAVIDLAVLKGGDVVALTSRAIYRFDGEHWTQALQLPLLHPLPEGGGSLKVGSDGALWINLAHPDWHLRWSQASGYTSSREPQFGTLRYEFDDVPPTTVLTVTADAAKGARDFTAVMEGWDPVSRTPQRELHYSYRVNDGAWTKFSESPAFVLHQLPEGQHRIEARARDLDFNVDAIGAAAIVDVRIPFWRKSWFYPMLGVFGLAGVLVYVLNFRQRAKHVLELEQQKLSFFTNLSHEIRTPLALVMAPLERAMKLSNQPDLRDYLQQARRSSEELKRIVDQLLDFRRAQSGVMQSRPENTDLVAFVADLVKSFSVMAGERRQTVVLRSVEQTLLCRVDVTKLQSVLNNLVLNGLRYSPDGSVVVVGLQVNATELSAVTFSVEDRGFGMDADIIKVGLEPFTRGRDKRVHAVKGTGIGLAYVNELVKVCGGTITIQSPVDATNTEFPGTRVTVRMPVALLPAEPEEAAQLAGSGAESDAERLNGMAVELPVLLLVEDDQELGSFLVRELARSNHVLWERDGDAGLRRARETIPDIVLTDRMMPKLDGFELCRALRADIATAHIPIIMLTAASSRVNEMEGLRAGVSDFIGKPFSIEALEQRLENQLTIRNDLRAKLKQEIQRAHQEEEAAKIEDPFLKKANEITEKNLADYLFDADALATKLGMSRSSLYRRLQATVDLSPPIFIRTHRMRRAGQLLLGTTLGVAEVMEAVGILEQRTFNKWFKATFGCNPTDYRGSSKRGIKTTVSPQSA